MGSQEKEEGISLFDYFIKGWGVGQQFVISLHSTHMLDSSSKAMGAGRWRRNIRPGSKEIYNIILG